MRSGGRHVWVANSGNSTVTEFTAGDGSWVRTLSSSEFGLSDPVAVAVAGGRVWIGCFDGNSLTELPPG